MLAIKVTVKENRIAIDGLQQLVADTPQIGQQGLKQAVRGVHRNAMDFLNGPGRTSLRLTNRAAIIHADGRITNQKSRRRGQSDVLGARPGSYPVPVITANLKRLLDFLDPGQSKGPFSAGPMEAVVYDSADYATVIRDGTFSSSAYGPRDYLGDGFDKFNQGNGVARAMEEAAQAEIIKRGLA